MEEQNILGTPQPQPALKATAAILQKRVYQVDGRDRAGLGLALGLAILAADLLLGIVHGLPGLGVTLLVLAWEGVMLWYAGNGNSLEALKKPPSLWLTAAVVLLAADFALFSNRWFWVFNVLALLFLLVVQMFELFGRRTYPWWRPLMLIERLFLLVLGLFDHLPASLRALVGKGEKPVTRGVKYVFLGLAVTVPLLGVVLPLLTQADAVFALLAQRLSQSFALNLGSLAGRLALGAVLTPFLFGVLYALRRPAPWGLGETGEALVGKADPALATTVLAVLDGLYLLFVGVQVRALFGGAEYVAATGLSMAEYARSGFFQLVWVSAINLSVVLAAVGLTQRVGRLWRGVQLLSTVMVALSGVLLVSAAWRMSLYVGQYGLSFKRFLTYWGMGMLAIFCISAILKIWREGFAFFRVLLAAGTAGWILLNAANVDAVVSHYNVELYRSGNSAVMDLPYLASRSYDALPALELLPGSMKVYYDTTAEHWSYTLDDLIRDRRGAAAADASSWRTWTLSAYLAARGG